MAASSQIGNIDQECFPYSIYFEKIVGFEAFVGPVGWAPGRHPKAAVLVMIFNPNQSFGNRITNIAFAQGSQNLQ